MKIIIQKNNNDPFNHNERIERMFKAVKWAAELWNEPKKRPDLPDWCQYNGYPAPPIEVEDDLVRYITVSGCGVYTFTPLTIEFNGYRNSLAGGCCLCRLSIIGPPAPQREDGFRYQEDTPPVTAKNAERIDFHIFAPVGPMGLEVYYGGFYYPKITTTKPDQPF